jgi:hypothetical protein
VRSGRPVQRMNPEGQESARFEGIRAATRAAIIPTTGIAVMIPIRIKLSGILDMPMTPVAS